MTIKNTYNSQEWEKNSPLSSAFSPSEEAKKILQLPSDQRQSALQNFYKKLEKYHMDLVWVFDYARTEFGDLNFSNKTDVEIDEEIQKFLKNFSEKIQNFDKKTKEAIFSGIETYIANKKNAYKKLKEFKENPLEFFKKYKINIHSLDQLQWKIEVDVYRENLVLYIDERDDYIFQLRNSHGVFFPEYQIIFMKKTRSSRDRQDTLKHENQHSENQIFLKNAFLENDEFFKARQKIIKDSASFVRKFTETYQDVNIRISHILHEPRMKQMLLYFQDELLAQIKWNAPWDQIKIAFIHVYDYTKHMNYAWSSEVAQRLQTDYMNLIWKYIYEAEELVKNWVSLDILAMTPIEKWGRLLKNFSKNPENSEDISEEFIFENVQELENGQFFAKKIFENGDVWEGIFDENKKFIEWTKSLPHEFQEWKFLQENIINGKVKYVQSGEVVMEMGEFFEFWRILKNGVISYGEKRALAEVIKNGKISHFIFWPEWNEEKQYIKGNSAKINMNYSVLEKWKLLLKDGELYLQDGEIFFSKKICGFWF